MNKSVELFYIPSSKEPFFLRWESNLPDFPTFLVMLQVWNLPFWFSICIVLKQSETFKSSPFIIIPDYKLSEPLVTTNPPLFPFPRVRVTCWLCYVRYCGIHLPILT